MFVVDVGHVVTVAGGEGVADDAAQDRKPVVGAFYLAETGIVIRGEVGHHKGVDLAFMVGFSEMEQLGMAFLGSVPRGIAVEPLVVTAEDDPFVTVVVGGAESVDAETVDTALEQREPHDVGKSVAQALFVAQRLVDLVGGIGEQRRSQFFVVGALEVVFHLLRDGEVHLEDHVEGVIAVLCLVVRDAEHLFVDKGQHLLLLIGRVGVGEAYGAAVDLRAFEEIVVGTLAQQIDQFVDGYGIRIEGDAVAAGEHRFGQRTVCQLVAVAQPRAVVRLQYTVVDLRNGLVGRGIFGWVSFFLLCGVARRTGGEQQTYRKQERGQLCFHTANPFVFLQHIKPRTPRFGVFVRMDYRTNQLSEVNIHLPTS